MLSVEKELGFTSDVINMVVLRPYRPSDLPAMIAIDAACFEKDFLFGRTLMQRLAETAQALTLIAETPAGEIAGFTIAHCEQASAPETAYLVTLDVVPAMRSRGIGRMLLNAAERSICNGGAMRMDLHVHTENHVAVRFYEQQGYVLRDRVAQFYGRTGRDAYLYSKDLAQPASVDSIS